MVFTSVIIMIAIVAVAVGRLARPENIGLFNYLHLDTQIRVWRLFDGPFGQLVAGRTGSLSTSKCVHAMVAPQNINRVALPRS